MKQTVKTLLRKGIGAVLPASTRDALYRSYYDLPKKGSIFTHMAPEELLSLHRCVRSTLKDNYVAAEIGSYLGASSNYIANALKNKGTLYCIDTWGNHAMKYTAVDTDADNRDTYQEFLDNTARYKTQIVPLRGWSHDMIGPLKEKTRHLDFLFIDGDHNYEGVKTDWDLYSPLLHKGSLVAFHDTGWADGVLKVIDDHVVPSAKLVSYLPNMRVYEII